MQPKESLRSFMEGAVKRSKNKEESEKPLQEQNSKYHEDKGEHWRNLRAVVDAVAHIQRVFLATTEKTAVTQRVSHRPINANLASFEVRSESQQVTSWCRILR